MEPTHFLMVTVPVECLDHYNKLNLGAIYEGHFENGEFHGGGVITYPTGHKLKGTWLKGKLISKIFVFNDGLEVTYPWRYCQFPDRRLICFSFFSCIILV